LFFDDYIDEEDIPFLDPRARARSNKPWSKNHMATGTKGEKPSTKKDAQPGQVLVKLPFMRATKNTNLYGFERDALEKMNPQPAISSIYVRKDALDEAAAVEVSVLPVGAD
jgi:hypothetical protein